MKFGKTLLSNQIPEWSRNYISYKSIKREIKAASSTLPPTEEAITAVFFKLDRELEKVNTFYTYKQALIRRRLWILQEKKLEKSHDEKDELVLALKETRNQMNKLMWFAELNSKGFRKILKKLDKRLGLETQTVYWETKVAVLPFATPTQLRKELDLLTEWIQTLSVNEEETQPNNLSGVLSNNNSTLKLARYKSKNEDISEAIQNDNVEHLELLLKEDARINNTILELAVEHKSIACLKFLVKTLHLSLIEKLDINERNLLHRVCIRSPSSTELAKCLLELEPSLSIQKDFAGRRPLHYAAESNNAELVKALLLSAIDHHYYDNGGFADHIWQDREGFTPLFFGIIHGSTVAVKELIEVGEIHDIDELIAVSGVSPVLTDDDESSSSIDEHPEFLPDFARSLHHPSSVALACKLGNLELLKLLISKGASVDLADEDGETPLLFAIRSHFLDGVKVLIQEGHVDINLAEKVNGWTPLMIAASEGFADIVQELLDANANKDIVDHHGWTASEHAVFRGYLDIGRLTVPKDPKLYLNNPRPAKTTSTSSDEDTTTTTTNNNAPVKNMKTKASKYVSKASRLYGHKYLTDVCMIIITLGSNDVRNALCHKFIELSEKFQEKDGQRRLSLSVSATNASGEFPIIDLPTDFDSHPFYPEPIVLFTAKPDEVTLRFDLIETFGSSRNSNVLARGTSVLAGDFIFTKSKGFKGPTEKASLRGQQTVPLVQAKDLDCVGTLSFEFFVVTPFEHKNMKIGDRYTYYKSVDTQVIGHRGSGMNRKGSKLQVGENTVLSFVTAASLGAEYIEFDVQLTKDLVPVIYHDWTVTETGYDIPLNAITSEQFLNLRRSGSIKEYHTGVSDGGHGIVMPSLENRRSSLTQPPPSQQQQQQRQQPESTTPYSEGGNGYFSNGQISNGNGNRVNRSHSFSAGSPNRLDLSNPFDQTRTSKSGKMKGNGPETIQGPFTTLAETLKRVPISAGFNIEVKYPMIDEAEQDDLTQFQELNIYVDTILECIYDHAQQDRHIIFSSFHPEICLALNLKQPNYPVFFLTDAGTLPMADIRCNSLQGAVRFAKQADLLGIVAASEPILEAPRMVQVIKEMGLLLFTYGILNNEVENAIAQKSYGVDAVIVDSVLPVRKGLRGD